MIPKKLKGVGGELLIFYRYSNRRSRPETARIPLGAIVELRRREDKYGLVTMVHYNGIFIYVYQEELRPLTEAEHILYT